MLWKGSAFPIHGGGGGGRDFRHCLAKKCPPACGEEAFTVCGGSQGGRGETSLASLILASEKKKSVDVLVVSSHRCLRQTPAFSFGRNIFTGWLLLHKAVLKN